MTRGMPGDGRKEVAVERNAGGRKPLGMKRLGKERKGLPKERESGRRIVARAFLVCGK